MSSTGQDRGQGIDFGTVAVVGGWQRACACAEGGSGIGGLDPTSFTGDPDGRDVEAVTVGGLEHVQRGDARHLVLGGLATEEDDQPYAVRVGHEATVRLWQCGSRPPRSPRAVGGTVHGRDVTVAGVAIDSRDLTGGELFVPIRADRDGHEFIPAAIAAGAAACLCESEFVPAETTAVVVDDTARALLDLGRLARTRLGDRVVGITGSVGKTTVKDLTRSALASAIHGPCQSPLVQQ